MSIQRPIPTIPGISPRYPIGSISTKIAEMPEAEVSAKWSIRKTPGDTKARSVPASWHTATMHPPASSLSLARNRKRCTNQNHRYRSPRHIPPRTIWCPEKRRNGSENLQFSAGAECPASNKANRTLGPLYSARKNLGNSRRAATSGFANPLVSGRFRVHEKGLEPSKRVRRVLQTGWSRKRS